MAEEKRVGACELEGFVGKRHEHDRMFACLCSVGPQYNRDDIPYLGCLIDVRTADVPQAQRRSQPHRCRR